MRIAPIVLVTALGLAAPALFAEEPALAKPASATSEIQVGSLTVGDKAPALVIDKWVKGAPVSSFEQGKVTVVEFWATWCGPCKASMPHLSSLQREYKDKGVTIIGVTSIDPRNSLAGVEKMTTEKGDTMGYTVAWDQDRKTSNAYMIAAAQPGIPTAFIVDQTGTIAWIGSPFKMDKPLAEIVAGNWDVAAERSRFEPEQQKNLDWMRFSMAGKKKDTAGMLESGRKLIETRGNDSDAMNFVAWSIVDPARGLDFTTNKKLAELALDAAKRANDATNNSEAGLLDTLAWAYFANGDKTNAVATEKKAIGFAKSDELRKDLEESLARMQ
ncbi:MAG: TlpA family protein disulfide reductase [Phycisphaeraceae bacterium]|nr:TlpA family protein disulfide reductase [Phycisphaeraceae bacterium]